jgi:hypothetical protein
MEYALELVGVVERSVVRVPVNLFNGVKEIGKMSGFSGKRKFFSSWLSNIRFVEFLYALIKTPFVQHGPLYRIIYIIVKVYLEQFPEDALKKTAEGLGLLFARRAGKIILVPVLAEFLTEQIMCACGVKLALREVLSSVVGAALAIALYEGTVEQAEAASKLLKAHHPNIYHELRIRNLDMGYFMVEKPLNTFLKKHKVAYTKASSV